MKTINKNLLTKNIERIAKNDICENNVFGSAYYVSQCGETICREYFGVSNPETSIPVSENTLFRIASMTKPVTAMAVLILVDRGIISLSDPVKKFLPQFEKLHITSSDGVDLGAAKTDITILHLLTHTSGIGDSKYSKMTAKDKETVNDTVNYFAKAGLDFEPFSRQRYSGVAGFDLLVAVIEELTGEGFESFLYREIFSPCNMYNTTFSPSAEQWERMAIMHNKTDGESCIGNMYNNCIFEDFPCSHSLGGAGLVSSLLDYASFATMLLNKGKAERGRIVSENTFSLLAKPYVLKEKLPGNYNRGLGVRVITENEDNILPSGSFGWSGAYGPHFWIDPQNEIIGVYMKNSRFDGGSFGKSASRFERAVYDSLILKRSWNNV